MSGVSADLARDRLPEGTTFEDLGSHHLKDLARPEHVFRLAAPDLAHTFPPLRSLELFANNLPPQVTTFVGRERESAEISALLETSRLVTIVGAGGIGKSRISIRVAAERLDGSSDGTWFVELAALNDGAMIVPAIAQTLSLELSVRADPLAALVEELRSKRLLLVLDNCEHLIAASAAIAGAILRGCPKVAILASSREALGIGGEATYRLPSLPVPLTGTTLSAAEALSFAGVSLFAQRAAAADSRFALSDETATIACDICRRLDGIALAIELAASRVASLGLENIHVRLDERFKLLTGGRRDVLPRHQTLRATIDWSYDLLGESERAVLRRAAIFVNGWTLEAAEAVASDESIAAWEIIDVLASLVDKSLVATEPDESGLRYRLLESTRQYALEKLAAAGERERFARRHAEWYGELATQTNSDSQASFDNAAWRRIFADIDNFRSAIAWAEGADFPLAVRLTGYVSWHEVGAPLEGLALVERLSARADDAIPARDYARLMFAAACCTEALWRRTESASFAAAGLASARTAGDALLTASCLLFTLMPTIDLATPIGPDVDAKIAELRELAATVPSSRLQQAIDNYEFLLSLRLDRVERARTLADLMLARVKKASGRPFLTLRANVAEFAYYLGETARAIAIIEDCMDELIASRNRELARGMLSNLTGYRALAGDLRGARQSLRQALTFAPITPKAASTTCFVLEHFAFVLAREGRHEAAARLAGFCERMRSTIGVDRDRTEQGSKDALDALLNEHLDAAAIAALGAAGARQTLEQTVSEALST